jgi:2,3-bisphosphoglycerate-dependent phosphoglycerate mutase
MLANPFNSFFFLRHGQTTWNREGRLQGSIDIPLNEAGRLQSIDIAHQLSSLGIKRIFASPLLRAYETATIVGSHLNLTVDSHHGLRERGFGSNEGYRNQDHPKRPWVSDNRALSFELDGPSKNISAPDAEPFNVFVQRTTLALLEIIDLSDNQLTLVVAHGGVFRALTYALMNDFLTADNCAAYRFLPSKSLHKPTEANQLLPEKLRGYFWRLEQIR